MDINCKKCNRRIPFNDLELCPDCQEEINEIFKIIYDMQPKKNRDIDQFGLTKQSILSQTVYISKSFNKNASALFGGYDGVGLLSPFFGQKKVIVLDLDKRVLEWWDRVGKACGFEVLTYAYDAHDPVPDEIIESIEKEKIDFWRTDPPFNCAGMLCFFNRILYLDSNRAPLYLTIPVDARWAQLLKHQIFEFKKKNNIIRVSPDINKYLDADGPDSVVYEFDVDSPIFDNVHFRFDTKRPTLEFSESEFGCKMFERCKTWREEWDEEVEKKR